MKITIIGAGNVATQLAKRFYEKQCKILQVFNRTLENAQTLASLVNSEAIYNPKEINLNADFYIIAVNDDVIEHTAKQLSLILPKDKIIVHTSGATSSKVLQSCFENYGVFYPLQTFSKSQNADFDRLPICIHGSNDVTKNQLLTLAQTICPNVHFIDDEQRSTLHVAAVFANNFTNHLFAISERIATDANIPFDLLKPLINETVAKINENKPLLMQTGPAKRGDIKTLDRHIEYLKQYPTYHQIYALLSKDIQAFYSSKKDSFR